MKRLKPYLPANSSLSVRELDQAHRFFAKRGVADSFGDGFLVAENEFLAGLRERFLGLGGVFESGSVDYNAMPLLCIDQIVEERIVYYVPNAFWLKRLSRLPLTADEWFALEPRLNYLVHETPHVVAYAQFFGRKKMKDIPKSKIGLLAILAVESFANAFEAVSSTQNQGPIAEAFYSGNSYFVPSRLERRKIQKLLDEHGLQSVFKAIFSTFLLANTGFQRLGSAHRRQISKFCNLHVKAISTIESMAFQLCEKFRTSTTALHLLTIGFPLELQAKIRADDPIEEFFQQKVFCRNLDKLLTDVFERPNAKKIPQ